jgi:hypothetical protein
MDVAWHVTRVSRLPEVAEVVLVLGQRALHRRLTHLPRHVVAPRKVLIWERIYLKGASRQILVITIVSRDD